MVAGSIKAVGHQKHNELAAARGVWPMKELVRQLIKSLQILGTHSVSAEDRSNLRASNPSQCQATHEVVLVIQQLWQR